MVLFFFSGGDWMANWVGYAVADVGGVIFRGLKRIKVYYF